MDRRSGSPRPSSRAAAEPRNGRSSSLDAERRRVSGLLASESEAHAGGVRFVAGVDEAGRGALAGPVHAGAVVLPPGPPILGLDDSKKLAPEVREDLSRRIRAAALGWGVGSASPAEVDDLGIAPASFLAMRRALAALEASFGRPGLVLVDGFAIPSLPFPQRAVVRGDATVACIAAASILAKTARDAVLERLDRERPWYGFGSHKGYGSAAHLAALRLHGPSPDHRLSFAGVLSPARAASTVAAA